MFNVLIAVSLFYVFILFVVAFGAEKLTNSDELGGCASISIYSIVINLLYRMTFTAPLVMPHAPDWNI